MNKEEKVLEVAQSKPGLSRRALAISAGVGYQTIVKMVDSGQLIMDAGGRVEAADVPEKELDLDIFGAESRGRLSKWGDRKVISIRSTIATLTKSAFEAMGVNLNAGDRCTLAINRLDRSVYVGVTPAFATKKGYTVRHADGGSNYQFSSTKAIGNGVPDGVYEIIGKGSSYAGGRWYPMQLIEK